MSTRGKIGVTALLFLLVALTIMGAAQSPEQPKVKIVQSGVIAGVNDKGVNLSFKIERSGAFPISGTVEASLFDVSGKRLVRASREIHLLLNNTQVEISVPASIEPSRPERYIVEWGFKSKRGGFSERSSLYNLVPMLETRVLGANELMAGSETSIRVIVRDINRQVFIEGATVDILLDGKQVFSGKTDQKGTVSPSFRAPEEAGSVKLAVRVDSPQGTDAYENTITVKKVERVLLVTDKPLYQPGQDMHLRALALRQPDLKPLDNKEVTFEVEDSKGNKVFKKTTKTDAYGISSAIFTLASEVNMGPYKVRATIGEATKIEKTVTVARYVLPKFKISFQADHPFYMPGQTVRGSLDANYFFGKPVARGEVKITASKFDVGVQAFATLEGKTDAEGHYSFELALPDYFVGEPLEQGKARVQLEIIVTDGSGHEEIKNTELTVAREAIILDAIPENSTLVKGVPNQIFIMASQPGGEPAKVEIRDPFSNNWIASDDLGLVTLSVTPKSDRVEFNISARDNAGNKASRIFNFASGGTNAAILLRTDHGIYRAGDSMRLFVLSQLDGAAYIDLVQENQTIHTAWTDVRNGVGEINLQVPFNSQGSAVVHAYRLTPDGKWLRDTRRVFIEPATELKIDVRPGKETYLPAEEAKIHFFVKDAKGNPVAAALGIQIVDESVFALQEMRPGLEKIYFLLEEELAKPRYEIHGFSIPEIISDGGAPDHQAGPVRKPENQARNDRLSQVLLAAAHTDMQYGIVANTVDTRRSKFQQAMQEYLEARAKEIIASGNRYRSRHGNREIDYADRINSFLADGLLKRSDILDPWGKIIKIEGTHPWPQLTSAGPDGKFGTEDDIAYQTPMPMPDEEFAEDRVMRRRAEGMPRPVMAMPPRAADGQGAGARNGRPKMIAHKAASEPSSSEAAAGVEEPRIRSYFPETLWVEPSLITDGQGHATATVQMADSITTWRLTAMANSKKGALGSASHGIRVFQEFFVDLNLPVALTRNDRVTIPVAVYNYLPGSQTVRLEIERADWFELNGDATQTVKLEKNEVKGIGFDITVKDVGNHALTVKAYGSSRSDAVRRTVEVIPDGQEQVVNFNARIEGRVEQELSFPAGVVPGANKLFVKVYPGLLSQVVEGLDNIFQMPSGCFEQTSSTTYPNVLVLNYIQKSGKITPELKMKAEGYINSGYQRLLTFEVKGGGFEWFGQAPAHIVLTAYGLMEFYDMSKVSNVDPALIKRTQEWLASQQQANGSWKPNQRVLDQIAGRFTSDVLRNTAYVAWALASSGYEGDALRKAIAYLKENSKDAKDLYTKALIVMALASKDPKDPAARELMSGIIEAGVVKGNTISFPAGADTAVHSSGQSADVETTALVGLALLKMGTHRDALEKVINYLIASKDARGTWYSTQATVFSLKTLIGSLDMSTTGGNADVLVTMDGKERGKFSLKGEKAELLQQIDLSEFATTGSHKISLKISGEGNAFYSIVARHYIPWSQLQPAGKAPFSITVNYDKQQLATNDMVTANVVAQNLTPAVAHMIILDLGIPPGFEVQTEDLDNYVEKGTIKRYSMTGRQIIVYLERIEPKSKVELNYRLKATMPMRAATFASRVYEYYNPARESFANPVKIEVRQ